MRPNKALQRDVTKFAEKQKRKFGAAPELRR